MPERVLGEQVGGRGMGALSRAGAHVEQGWWREAIDREGGSGARAGHRVGSRAWGQLGKNACGRAGEGYGHVPALCVGALSGAPQDRQVPCGAGRMEEGRRCVWGIGGHRGVKTAGRSGAVASHEWGAALGRRTTPGQAGGQRVGKSYSGR